MGDADALVDQEDAERGEGLAGAVAQGAPLSVMIASGSP